MNSSTSCFCTSRKYSAMVSAGQRDPQPGARRLVHLAEDQRGVLEDAGLGHLQEEVVALAGALPDAGEHRHATEVLGDPADHLLDQHGLADAGTAEQADLAADHVRGEQVDDLDAGLEHLGLAARAGRAAAAGRWIGQRSVMSSRGRRHVQRLAERVEDVALGDVADRHRDRRSRCRVTAAPRTRPSVGCMEIARTMLSPMCWATSRVSVLRQLAERRRRRAARCRSPASRRRANSTSTTGPMTRTTRPVPASAAVCGRVLCRLRS